ncbi:MAG: hypothetical protein RMI94_08480 [Bryobacterales bacterium]|nr:hypothetical protein [Bryobacterales bacterium]
MTGSCIRLEFRDQLRARSGRLVPRPPGVEVHAAAMLRRRKIYLESALLGNLGELRRILIHELFHFVWMRLGNLLRREWEELLRGEMVAGARGELGHSAQWRKQALARSAACGRSRLWRQYVCESFCDSAAWWFLRPARHEEFTLGKRWRERRARWLAHLLDRHALPV